MRSRLQTLIESILYAGLKPKKGLPAQAARETGRFRHIFERFVSGSAPSDPLYLSNRTLGQRLRLPLLIAAPLLLISGFIFLAMSNQYFFQPKDAAPVELTPAQVAAKMLPDLSGLTLDASHDLEISDVHVELGAGRLSGTARNNTTHTIGSADVLFDLADRNGSRLGTVKAQLKSLPPESASTFTLPIEQRTAVFVVVRNVRTR